MYILYIGLSNIILFRYELREDRKREAAKNTCQIDSIKRDIIRSLRGNQAWMPSNYGCMPSQDIPSPISSAGLMTPMEFESLKQELITCLRDEMRTLLTREHLPQGVQQPPMVNSELYETHLYTQL